MLQKVKTIMLKKKVMIPVLLIAVLGMAGLKITMMNKPLEVETVFIEKTNFEDYHFEESTVKSKDSIRVYTPAAGNIAELLVKEGGLVKKGDIILRIDTEDMQYDLDILMAQKESLIAQKKSDGQVVKTSQIDLQKEAIQIAKNDVASSAVELERKKKLLSSGGISKKAFEDLEQQYKQAISKLNIEEFKLTTLEEGIKQGEDKNKYYDSQIEKLLIEIEKIENKISEMQVVAPIGGIISDLNINRGDLVSSSQQLFNIFNPGLYEIESYVLAKEVKNLEVGMETYIELENTSSIKHIKGVITYIAPNAIDLVSPLGLVEKKVKVMIDPIEESNFILGEEVDVRFITYKKDNAQLVSKDYIFPMDSGEAIWVIEDGKAKILNINKEYDTSASIILKGELGSDVKVIVPPYPDKIQEGMEVKSNVTK